MLITPGTPIFVRFPGGRDPDITIEGRVTESENGQLNADLKVVWDDSYITERHDVSGVIASNTVHPASTIHCRYLFSGTKDPYEMLARTNAQPTEGNATKANASQ
ncbi:hypothetical protein [Blastopirellula marina]|uniref:Uncharacterized protein n=1 Tax=Blastopirellula marina TaxID=124 RepID=A0A2S8GLK9_9BACT|nr:hypothetical protein [Blastopirellula marina]PQO45323.1 hypothetical protein C5Y93_15335 [Blastopirellula marina]